MKRKILMISSFILAIGGAFATKTNTSHPTTTYYITPGCSSVMDCQGGTITCAHHFSDSQCLDPVSPKKN